MSGPAAPAKVDETDGPLEPSAGETRQPFGSVALAAALAVIITATLTAAVGYRLTFRGGVTDYTAHAVFAEQFARTGNPPVPHFLFHAFVLSLHAGWRLVTGEDTGFEMPTVVAATIFSGSLAAALVCYLALRIPMLRARPLALAALAISLNLASPIPILIASDGLRYFGYIGINVYHNPTVTAVRPFALVSFVFAGMAVTGENSAGKWTVPVAAIVVLLATLTKPSYTMCLIPALLLMAGASRAVRRDLNRKLFWAGMVIPAVLLLAVQFRTTYGGPKEGIVLMPLAAMSILSGNLLPKFLAAIAFPAVVALADLRRAARSRRLALAWITFLISAAMLYLLAESGKRMAHANFMWGAQVCLFILVVESVVHALEGLRARSPANWLWLAARQPWAWLHAAQTLSGLWYFKVVLRTFNIA